MAARAEIRPRLFKFGQRVLAAPGVRGVVVHPAMVFEGLGGVFARLAADARSLGRVRVVGDGRARWPLVHRRDLAELYALALVFRPRR